MPRRRAISRKKNTTKFLIFLIYFFSKYFFYVESKIVKPHEQRKQTKCKKWIDKMLDWLWGTEQRALSTEHWNTDDRADTHTHTHTLTGAMLPELSVCLRPQYNAAPLLSSLITACVYVPNFGQCIGTEAWQHWPVGGCQPKQCTPGASAPPSYATA